MDSKDSDEVPITDLFEQFIEASTMKNILSIHRRILDYAELEPCEFNVFFPKLKRAVVANRQRKNWKAKALFSKIDKRAAHRCYSNTKASAPLASRNSENQSGPHQDMVDDNRSSQSNRNFSNNTALQNYNCLIIGSGPAGLRTAIELQLLGASKVMIVEKRSRFSRNNVLHLWPFVIDDLKSLGAKKFYGKFCAGSIDHISIRQLQLMLLKVCLMIGCEFRDSCSYVRLCPESIKLSAPPTSNENSSDIKEAKCSNGIEQNTSLCDLETTSSSKAEDDINGTAHHPTQVDRPNLETKASDDSFSHRQAEEVLETQNTKQLHDSIPSSLKAEKLHHKSLDNLHGTRAHFQCEQKYLEKELHSHEWDMIIGADGRRNTLSKFFPRKEFRGRLAIAITANFINRQTPAETSVPEISGLSFIYNQDMFNALAYDTNIQLENICYYKDDTHYFVMTAKKKSLLERGVLINDYPATQDLLSDNNIDRRALLKYAKDAAFWTTGLEPLDFALNHYGQEDCAMFDFTSMYAASNACKALRTKKGGLALVALVGDSLLEPFWPTGSGCARGFLSSFDAAWMCRQWAVNKCALLDHHNSVSSRSSRNRSSTSSVDGDRALEATTYNRMALSVIAERESIYRILAQTTSENLQQNYSQWTLNPHTRYPNLNRHLILPSQVEHLMTDYDFKLENGLSTPWTERGRRVKSPNMLTANRKSPKKLKSANSSPLAQPKNPKMRSKSLSKYANNSRSRNELALDSTYIEFEESYKNLADSETGLNQYLNHRRQEYDASEDIFIPSISGTLPSSNNLLNLEARRNRDIDECLRQRRQKTKINFVRDQLISQFRESGHGKGGNAALFNELKRLREIQSRGGRQDSKPREVNGPLSLLNSMRRCASFAERVKSFENKMASSSIDQSDSNATTPKTPIDNVRNLPQFATLQELFVNKSASNREPLKKSRIPITKLSKDDWNIKCWEKRVAAYKQRSEMNGSSKSLNKSFSVDSHCNHHQAKPQKQVEVFQDRIKEMAEKLRAAKGSNQKLHANCEIEKSAISNEDSENSCLAGRAIENRVGSRGWVNHLKRELTKSSGSRSAYPMNPVTPNKPIKKLFADDEDDDGIDVNKHYDHLCINRPINKYLSKGAYTSHLSRTKYNSATSKVVNRPKPTADSKQPYLVNLTSRGSSVSSTLSDAGNSSSGSGKHSSIVDVECSRCRKFVSSADRITIGDSTLHRICLTCANCRITLRSNEVQHYLDLIKGQEDDRAQNASFLCAICKPDIRSDLEREDADRLAASQREAGEDQQEYNNAKDMAQRRQKSREEFLNARINYNELYKNILSGEQENAQQTNTVRKESSSRVAVTLSAGDGLDQFDERTTLSSDEFRLSDDHKIRPSPVQVTLPLKLVIDGHPSPENLDNEVKRTKSPGFRIARTETVDGGEQVTVVLPGASTVEIVTSDESATKSQPPEREMIDEEELQRILHLDNPCKPSGKGSRGRRTSLASNSSSDVTSASRDDNGEDEEDDDDSDCLDGENKGGVERPKQADSEDSSSLNSPGEFDEEDDIDQNSTYDDFVTSEELDPASDKDDIEADSGDRSNDPDEPVRSLPETGRMASN